MIWLILGVVAFLWLILSIARAAGRTSDAERRRDADR